MTQMNTDIRIVETSPLPPLETTRMNVLILDDIEADRLRIRRFLSKAGLHFKLYEAFDLDSFRKQIDRAPMDLVFIDYLLDVDTGLDALRILSEDDKQASALPIMVTSVDRCDIAVEAMRNGCADYLIKEQLTVEAIRKSIASALERRILLSSLSETHNSREALRLSVSKFARTCGPQIRAVLAATLRHSRTARDFVDTGSQMAKTLNDLEGSCHDIYGFFGELYDLVEMLDASDTSSTRHRLGRG